MALRLPVIETDRLVIREFTVADLPGLHEILDVEAGSGVSLEARRAWLDWSVASYREHAGLYQPPYGDRAVTLRDGMLIGAVGYSPMLHPLSEMLRGADAGRAQWMPEVGLYYAFSAAGRGQGYATEAAGALVEYAFEHFRLHRIVANTEFSNLASQRVMQRLGMTLYRNEDGEPPWFEVLGVLENI